MPSVLYILNLETREITFTDLTAEERAELRSITDDYELPELDSAE